MCGQCSCQERRHECGCNESHHFQRRYQTHAEKIADLEDYLDELRNETKAVEEEIAGLKKGA